MKSLDAYLQKMRYKKADGYVRTGDRVLDIGCYDGSFLARHVGRASLLVGVDKHLVESDAPIPGIQLINGTIDDIPADHQFDVVTAMAVLEHLTPAEDAHLAERLRHLTTADARFVITVPSPLVDRILDVLIFLRILDGMDIEAHHGQSISELMHTFETNGWAVETRKRFQLGLNNLIVFRRA